MFFNKRFNRVVNLNVHDEEPREPLEKGDKLAMFIAAVAVFLPALLVFIAVVFGLAWLFVR